MSFPGDIKLTLRKEMENTWLIQRLRKPYSWQIKGKKIDNLFSFGGGLINGGISSKAMDIIREVFSFDYMGSSEFEWGAVPQAISFLAEQASKNNLVIGQIDFTKNETVYYISPKEYETEVINRIKELRKPYGGNIGIQLQEACMLDTFFDSKREYGKRNVGWMELDNGFMFFTDKTMFQNTCELFEVKDGTK